MQSRAVLLPLGQIAIQQQFCILLAVGFRQSAFGLCVVLQVVPCN